MKKLLLLQTALVAGAGLFVADIAAAQVKAEPINITLGGYLTEVFKAADLDNSRTNANRQDHGFGAADAEIWFNIRAVLDNGVIIGGRVELEGSTEVDQIDERYLFIERADIGRAEIGSTDRAASKMVYGAPMAIPGYGTIDPPGVIALVTAPTGARTANNYSKFTGAPDDAEGINLYTASNRYFGSKAGRGLQLGFSYVPDGCQDASSSSTTPGANCGTSSFPNNNDPGQMSKAFTAAVNYLESVGSFDVGLFAGYNRFDIESTAAASAAAAAGGAATVYNNNGLQGYAFGTTITYNIGDGSSVQLGGLWKREEMGVTPSGDDKRNVYTAGLRYLTNGVRPGSVGIGFDWALTKADQGNIGGVAVAGEDDFTWYSLGVTYQIASGILGFGGVGRYEYEDAVAAGTVVGGVTQLDNDAKANFAVVGMRLDF